MQGLEIALQIPDIWQQEAVRVLTAGGDVVVDAPTGAGKTWVFELFVKARKSGAGQAVFTVPTRALANDKWREWRKLGWDVGIATGDLAENLGAPVLVATLETQRERILSGDAPKLLAIDEYQMIADKARGLNYELALALAPPETQLLLASGSVENPEDIVAWLRRLGRDAHLVQTLERPVPLEEMPVEELPRLPEKTGAFWARVAAGACLASFEPLLLFAPRREAAETMARKIAAALPDDDPIELPAPLANRAGKPLCKLLRSRVAYHHSGLDYETRAAVVEPLVKAGQLRVVVATTGLAAGINFSVRSVAITDTSYREGAFLRDLGSDEILQMFGRAGRRGLDEVGYVITARHTPTLFDAGARKLRRVNQIDWPTLLRVMKRASVEDRDPFSAAAEACARLFSTQKLALGIEADAKPAAQDRELVQGHFDGPRRIEFEGSDGRWHPLEGAAGRRPLSQCLVRDGESGEWGEALRDAEFVKSVGRGRLCRIAGRFGIEVKVGRLLKANAEGVRKVKPLGWVRLAIGDESLGKMTRSEFEELVLPELGAHFEVGDVHRLVRRGALLAAQMDLSATEQECVIDPEGQALVAPQQRTVAVDVDTHYETGGRAIDPPSGSVAHNWRKLGLVDTGGCPTLRGEVFSLFQGGEGLMVAAGLEDESYPVEELAWHLANIRAGSRFRETEGGGSSRLAVAARSTYGMVDHDGYLELGLSPGYGEGAAEVLQEELLGHGFDSGDGLAAGDIERAKVEWLSLLRHIFCASQLDWPRWQSLASACGQLLERFGAKTGSAQFEPLDAVAVGRRPRRLHRNDFR